MRILIFATACWALNDLMETVGITLDEVFPREVCLRSFKAQRSSNQYRHPSFLRYPRARFFY